VRVSELLLSWASGFDYHFLDSTAGSDFDFGLRDLSFEHSS
jgi:hypothetical protein